MEGASPCLPAEPVQWRLTRRCSLTPRQLLLSYAAILAMGGATSALFGWHGVWMVPAWCLLQALLCGAMYLVHMAHALDGEQITLGPDGTLAVEVVRGTRTRHYRMNPAWSRLERGGPCRDRLWLCSSRTRVEVASQLRPHDKRRVEREIRQMLARTRSGAPLPL
jgi:uncharacterized membrane protein